MRTTLYVSTADQNDVVTLSTIFERYYAINGTHDGFEDYVNGGFRNELEVEYIEKPKEYTITAKSFSRYYKTFVLTHSSLDESIEVNVAYNESDTETDMIIRIEDNMMDIINYHIISKAFEKIQHIADKANTRLTESQRIMMTTYTKVGNMLDDKGITL